jgi:hypothetical protein
MRSILFAAVVAAGIGLAGTATPTVAAPVSGAVIGELGSLSSAATLVQHRRRRSWRHHRRGRSWHYRPYRYHSRWRSRGPRIHSTWRSRRFSRCHILPFSTWVAC